MFVPSLSWFNDHCQFKMVLQKVRFSHRLSRLSKVAPIVLQKPPFILNRFQPSVCLSRACLGKMIVFMMYKKRLLIKMKGVFRTTVSLAFQEPLPDTLTVVLLLHDYLLNTIRGQ